ncbi:hypothetical protein ABBQ38_006579 [Trebouxia sp. C0009 RCD-2024]
MRQSLPGGCTLTTVQWTFAGVDFPCSGRAVSWTLFFFCRRLQFFTFCQECIYNHVIEFTLAGAPCLPSLQRIYPGLCSSFDAPYTS